MNAKEKAKELVYLMQWEGEMSEDEAFKDFAKECALIAVDEIIEVLVDLSNGEFTYIHNVEYWQEVKQFIEEI